MIRVWGCSTQQVVLASVQYYCPIDGPYTICNLSLATCNVSFCFYLTFYYYISVNKFHAQTIPNFSAPHQPRLDWQMWFAALGTYHQNPWLMSLTYRILTDQKEVLALMDQEHNPFKNQPPKYLRASLYHYHYTTWSQR